MRIWKVKNTKGVGFLLLVFALIMASCSMEKRTIKQVNRMVKQSEVLKQHHFGFELYNMDQQRVVLEKNAEKYFTPASNTKWFTFYAGLKMVPDSIPALRYLEKGDSLIFWGTGDPSFLQTRLKGRKAYDFLKGSTKQLFYAPGRYTGAFYGSGWQWDDYNDYYQAEINDLPVMDNLVAFKDVNGSLGVSPSLFNTSVLRDTLNKDTIFSVKRAFTNNAFRYPSVPVPLNYEQQVPYKVDPTITIALLADTLGRRVGLIDVPMPANAKTVYGMKTDSVLKEMMIPSDNFIAEQLLLVYANQIGGVLNAGKAIAYIEQHELSGLPDKPRWVDGSGLSRYNLVTPRTMVALLRMIYQQVNNPKKLYSMLPAGGMRGTLKNAYAKTAEPFVYGKTGSFSNNYNQSGYLLTKKGKTYIFSFMNNNFVEPTAAIRTEIAKIMTYIHEQL